MLFFLSNVSAEILLNMLGNSFYAKYHILVHFLQNAVKSICNFLRIRCSALVPKVLLNAGDSFKLLAHSNFFASLGRQPSL